MFGKKKKRSFDDSTVVYPTNATVSLNGINFEQQDKSKYELEEEPIKDDSDQLTLTAIAEEDGKIKVGLDWDDDFIRKLKQAGYTGANDEVIIQKYLLELTKQVADDMSGDTEYE